MVKNEKYVKISTHVGSTTFVPHFTIVERNAFSNLAERVEPYGEHFEFVPVSYDALNITNSLELTTSSYNYNNGNSIAIAMEKKVYGTNRN
jgi:hypothetical protein